MTKRPAWKSQGRREISNLLAAHSASPLSEIGQIALRFKGVPTNELPPEPRVALLRSAANFLSDVANTKFEDDLIANRQPLEAASAESNPKKGPAKLVVRSRGNFRKILRNQPEIIPASDQQELAAIAIQHVLEEESRNVPERMKQAATIYLNARHIPVEEPALTGAITVYLDHYDNGSVARGIDMKLMELLYIKARKEDRKLMLEISTEANSLARRIYGGQNFTENQKKSVRKLVERRFYELRADEAAIQSERSRFGLLYKPQHKTPGAAAKQPSPVKLGKKEERVAAHCLEIIESAHNPDVAAQFRRLLEEGVITTDTLNSVSEGGADTQMVFLMAIQRYSFITHFGPNRVDHLARGLASIGKRRSRNRESAQREFGSSEAERMLEFLQTNGLISHVRGGKLVQLESPSYQFGQI